MRPPKKKPTGAKLRSWGVAIMRARAHNLGTVEAPDAKAAEAFASPRAAQAAVDLGARGMNKRRVARPTRR
jgi:hypothetical protein